MIGHSVKTPMHSLIIFVATCLILCIFLTLSASFNAIGKTIYEFQEVFTVANIHVDVTAKTASAARKEALKKGEKEAFNLLLKRLTLRIDQKRLPILGPKQISTYIQDFGVTNEKNSGIRYLANLTYRFKPTDIRLLLRDNEIQFAETISKPILVLPVYQLAGAVFLWDNPNPWREALLGKPKIIKTKMRNRVAGLVPLMFGNGDLADIATISAELAVKGDLKSLAAIAKKYKVGKTLVILASLTSTPQQIPTLKVQILQYVRDNNGHVFSMKIEANKLENFGDFLNRSATEVTERIEELWKAENLLKFENMGVVAATFPTNSLAEWVDAKRRLVKVAVIENIEPVIFSRKEIRFNIHFIGDVDQLKLALAQTDMELKEHKIGWVLRVQKPVQSDAKKGIKQK
jgi:hypothetical protein